MCELATSCSLRSYRQVVSIGEVVPIRDVDELATPLRRLSLDG